MLRLTPCCPCDKSRQRQMPISIQSESTMCPKSSRKQSCLPQASKVSSKRRSVKEYDTASAKLSKSSRVSTKSSKSYATSSSRGSLHARDDSAIFLDDEESSWNGTSTLASSWDHPPEAPMPPGWESYDELLTQSSYSSQSSDDRSDNGLRCIGAWSDDDIRSSSHKRFDFHQPAETWGFDEAPARPYPGRLSTPELPCTSICFEFCHCCSREEDRADELWYHMARERKAKVNAQCESCITMTKRSGRRALTRPSGAGSRLH